MRQILLVLLAVSGVACGDPGSSPSAPPTAQATTAPVASSVQAPSTSAAPSTAASAADSGEAPPPPYSGTLTVPMVLAAGRAVHPFDAWGEAMTRLEKIAGKPTETHAAYSCWGAVEGEVSACFCIEKTTFEALKRPGMKGPAVGSTDSPRRLDATSLEGDRAICKKLAGKK